MVAGAARAGDVEIVALVDTVGVLGRYETLFPTVPDESWERWRGRYPELFAGDSWRLPFGSFLLRTPTGTILVDTGVGPAGGGSWLPDRQGRLLDELERAGVRAIDVDVVFNTHIHFDHVGWNQAFERARLVMHEANWQLAHERADREHVRPSLLALADRVETIEGDAELAPGVVAFDTPGHAPGHMSVRVGEEVILLGDVAPHPAQLADPTLVFDYDEDAETAVLTRRQLLAAYGDRILACGHFPAGGFGRLADGVWIPVG